MATNSAGPIQLSASTASIAKQYFLANGLHGCSQDHSDGGNISWWTWKAHSRVHAGKDPGVAGLSSFEIEMRCFAGSSQWVKPPRAGHTR